MKVHMRTSLAFLVLALSLLSQDPSVPPAAKTRIGQVMDGRVEQQTYFNEAFEDSFRIRDGWTISLVPAGTTLFAPDRSANDPVNSCSRALFSSEPTSLASRPFGPKVTYFAFDPECFPGAPFPKSGTNRKAVTAFAQRVVAALKLTPYIPPGGADFGGFNAGKRPIVTLKADYTVDPAGAPTEPPNKVHVNTLLMLIESSDYWIVMAEIVDDDAKKTMEASNFELSDRH